MPCSRVRPITDPGAAGPRVDPPHPLPSRIFYSETHRSNAGLTVAQCGFCPEYDPRYAVAEEWEPGIPRVQVNLHRDVNSDKIP